MKKKLSGFTLIEAMITVAIIGIVISMVIPSMNSFVTNNQLTSRNNNLVSALQYAKSAAIKYHARVFLCPSKTASEAMPTCSGENDWLPGMIIFVDKDDSLTFNNSNELLKQFDNRTGQTPSISITAEVLRAGEPVTIYDYISFVSPRGEPQDKGGVNQSGIFKICDLNDEDRVRGVMIHPSGRIYSSRDKTTLGSHISCVISL